MTVNELISAADAQVLSCGNTDRVISCGFVCDLLSWVMSGGKQDMAWVTVQTNVNVIAVAALHDIACVILPENIKMEGDTLERAKSEGITVLSSPKSAYELCGLMYAGGVKA